MSGTQASFRIGVEIVEQTLVAKRIGRETATLLVGLYCELALTEPHGARQSTRAVAVEKEDDLFTRLEAWQPVDLAGIGFTRVLATKQSESHLAVNRSLGAARHHHRDSGHRLSELRVLVHPHIQAATGEDPVCPERHLLEIERPHL